MPFLQSVRPVAGRVRATLSRPAVRSPPDQQPRGVRGRAAEGVDPSSLARRGARERRVRTAAPPPTAAAPARHGRRCLRAGCVCVRRAAGGGGERPVVERGGGAAGTGTSDRYEGEAAADAARAGRAAGARGRRNRRVMRGLVRSKVALANGWCSQRGCAVSMSAAVG